MASDQSGQITAHRRGFWILLGVVLFQIGYPIVLSAAFGTDPKVVVVIAIYAVLAALMFAGLTWARVLSVLLSGLLSCFLFVRMLSLIHILGERLAESWPTFLMIPIAPAIGYAVSAILLLAPSVGIWQRRVAGERSHASSNAIPEAELDDGVQRQECPWCQAIALRPTDEYCPSCKRPV